MAINTTLNTNLQPIWHCKRNDDGTFNNPKKYNVNVLVNNSIETINVAGVEIPQTLVCVCTKNVSNKFKVGDRFYYNKSIPKNHNLLQNDKLSSNFEMQEYPKNSINTSQITLRYLKGR